jgi:tetratricopeptide (TPR) repeat protein
MVSKFQLTIVRGLSSVPPGVMAAAILLSAAGLTTFVMQISPLVPFGIAIVMFVTVLLIHNTQKTPADRHMDKAGAFLEQMKFQEAIVEFNNAIELDSKNELAYLGRADAHFRRAEYDQALADYTTALELKPANKGLESTLYRFRGLTFLKLGRDDDAIAELTKAIEVSENQYGVAYSERAVIFERRGQAELATLDRERAKKLGVPEEQITAKQIGI